MHTTPIPTPHYPTARIHHDGDWCGDIKITWMSGGESVTIPAEVLKAAFSTAIVEDMKARIIAFVEDL